MICSRCGHLIPSSRLPLWVALEGVVILFLAAALCVLGWELDRLRDRVDRIPIMQHSAFQITGDYPHIRVFKQGWDLEEPEPEPYKPVKGVKK